MRRYFLVILAILSNVWAVSAACTATEQSADYSPVGTTTATLSTGTLGDGQGHTMNVAANGDLVAITAWCFQTCTPTSVSMSGQTATADTTHTPGTTVGIDGLHTGQAYIYYILNANAGNHTLTFTATGSSQIQVSYIDFKPSTGCVFSHDVDSSVGSATGGGTANTPSLSGVTGDILVGWTVTTQHVNSPVNAPWACPVYSGQGETQTCNIDVTQNGQAYILSASSGTISNNWTLINSSTGYEAILTSFKMTQNPTTYYISKSTGLDTHTSAQAQSKSTPWAHLPGMASCTSNCATYTPVAGDHFVLMGCDVWVPTDLPIEWQWSGASGSPITVTVDKTWFNTTNCPSTWNRPVFDGQNLGTADLFINICSSVQCSNVTFDNIEMKRGGGNDLRYINCFEGPCLNLIVSNMYLHAWHVVTDGSCVVFDIWGDSATAENSIIDGSDATGASPPGATCYGFGDGALPNIENNVIHDLANGIVGYVSGATSLIISGNLIYNVQESNAGSHPNAIEIVNGGTYYIHDNVLHDNAGESLMFGNTGETDFIWNNVIYGILGNSPEAPQVPGQSGMTFTAWNNTIVDTPGENCFHWNSGDGGTFTAVTVKNTHCISSGTTATASWNGTAATIANNTLMTAATATSQGYTSSETFAYSPTILSNSTIAAGANLTSSCSGNNAGLCSDTNYACTQQTISGVVQAVCPARTVNARASSGAWDSGAYQFGVANQCPSSVPSRVTICFYVSDVGSDTNSGAYESQAWIHAPGMGNCASNCLTERNSLNGGATGIGIILRGGDTWHFGNSSATPYTGSIAPGNGSGCDAGNSCGWTLGGSSNAWGSNAGNPIYIGVDQTWFSGASWARPIMTGDNPTSSTGVASCPHDLSTFSFIKTWTGTVNTIIDNLEFTGMCWSGTNRTVPYVDFGDAFQPSTTNRTIENSYFHGWSHVTFGVSSTGQGVSAVNEPSSDNSGIGDVITHNVFDGSDTDEKSYSGITFGGYDIDSNVFRYMTQGCITNNTHTMHDNVFDHLYGFSDGSAHGNGCEFNTEYAGNNVVYNNIWSNFAYDGVGCGNEQFQTAPKSGNTTYFFNNLIYGWGCGSNGNYFDVCGSPSPSCSTTTFTIQSFNNTMVLDDGGISALVATAPSTIHINWINNHGIMPSGGNNTTSFLSNSFGGTISYTTNVVMSTSVATTQGYTASESPFVYAPTAAGNGTVGVGTGQSSICNTLSGSADSVLAAAGAACKLDTGYACSFNSSNHTVTCPGRTAVTRPTSGAWDVGAYQFSGGGGNVPPNAPTSLQITNIQ